MPEQTLADLIEHFQGAYKRVYGQDTALRTHPKTGQQRLVEATWPYKVVTLRFKRVGYPLYLKWQNDTDGSPLLRQAIYYVEGAK